MYNPFTHRYMNRRCSFLDTLAAFNFNMGEGEYVTNEQGKQVCTDTKQLGSTLMTTMLREVKDFCDPDIKRNWSLKPHQQVSTRAAEIGNHGWLTPLLFLSSRCNSSFFLSFFLSCPLLPPILSFPPFLPLPSPLPPTLSVNL